jgi:hypothetical protein
MIYIKKGVTNKVVLTLSEKSTLTSPYYLFIFENEFDLEENPIPFTTSDQSHSTNRYNLFEITESDSGEDGGIDVDLKLIIGQYKYSIYESEIETLDINDTTGIIIESGRMVVVSDDIISGNIPYGGYDNLY